MLIQQMIWSLIMPRQGSYTSITKYRKINLIADKGYISKEKKENLAKEKINLIVPYRKNMKNKKTNKKMTNTEK